MCKAFLESHILRPVHMRIRNSGQAQPFCLESALFSFFLYTFLGTQFTYSTSLLKSCFLFLSHSQARNTNLPKLGELSGPLGPGPCSQAWMSITTFHTTALPRQIWAGRWEGSASLQQLADSGGAEGPAQEALSAPRNTPL